MKGVASGLLRSALTATRHATKATTKAVGQGVKEGIKNTVKNLTKEHAMKIVRGSLFSGSAAVPLSGGIVSHFYNPVEMASTVQYRFPASCECDYYAGAPVSSTGKKILTCHSCAPRGMGARNYQRALEVTILPEGPRARRKPSHLKNYVLANATRKSKSRSKSRSKTKSRAKSI